MPRDDVGILHRSATDSKDVVHERKGSMPNPASQDHGTARVQRPALNEDALRAERTGVTVATSVGTDTMPEMEAADWPSLSDQELLERRISALGLQLEGTPLEPLIRQLYDELSAKGLTFHPPCQVGDEWFVPIGIPAIFIPFFLVHDRLRALERTMMLEVEGGTPEWFMKLMRHEAGHAYMYAYRLTRKKKWQELFGQTSREETPDTYRPRPFSRSYVMH